MRVLRNRTTDAAHQRHGWQPALPGGTFQLPSGQVNRGNGAQAALAPAAITTAQSLLALQEHADRTARRRQMLHKSYSLLQCLEQLHQELLSGDVAPERAHALAGQLQRVDADPGEPDLSALLRQIELRCAVELAKLDHGADGCAVARQDRQSLGGGIKAVPGSRDRVAARSG